MIALVRVNGEDHQKFAELLPYLPPPPALRWSGFLISAQIPVSELCAWAHEARKQRPRLPLGIVLHDLKALPEIAASGLHFSPIVLPRDLCGESVPLPVLRSFRSYCIESELTLKLAAEYRPPPSMHDTIAVLISVGSAGGSRSRAAKCLGVSVSTLERRLKSAALPTAHYLLRDIRVATVQMNKAGGMPLQLAVNAAGWSSIKAYEKVLQRVRRSRCAILSGPWGPDAGDGKGGCSDLIRGFLGQR